MTKSFIKISKIIEKITIFFGLIGAWMAIPLMTIIIFDVISRRFFVLGSTKLQEMEFHLHTALFLLALVFAYVKNSHVRIEIVRERFPTIMKAWLEVIGVLLFLLPYTSMIIYYGIDFAGRSFQMNEVSAALTGLSHRWIIKSFVPFGMFILWLSGLSVLLRNIAFILSIERNDKNIQEESISISPELQVTEYIKTTKEKE